MPTETQLRNMMQDEIAKASSAGRYTLNLTPTHSHTGIDSPQVSYGDLIDRQVIATSTVFGASAATAANYGTFWTAPFDVSVQEMQVTYAHESVSGVVYIEILKPGQASGAGTAVQSFGTASSALVNQVGTSKLRPGSKAVILNANDRLSLFMSGDPTGLVQLSATVLLQINN